jgi:glycosyltransferase involved in cell wall biosynthesis
MCRSSIEKVDVIVPTKNDLKKAKKAVESVSKQNYPINQCIVVDDGSDVEVLKEDFEHITNLNVVIERTRGIGLAAARNVGLNLSSAKFVAFLDADDLWLPNKISNQINQIVTRSDAVGVCSGYKLVNNEGRLLKTVLPRRRTLTFQRIARNTVTVTGSASSVMVKSEIIKSIHGFDSRLSYAEDMDMWLRLSLIGPFLPVRYLDVVITSNPGSMQRKLSEVARAEKEMHVKLEILEKFAIEEKNVRKQVLISWANLIALDRRKFLTVQAFVKEHSSSYLIRDIKLHSVESGITILLYYIKQKTIMIKNELLTEIRRAVRKRSGIE